MQASMSLGTAKRCEPKGSEYDVSWKTDDGASPGHRETVGITTDLVGSAVELSGDYLADLICYRDSRVTS